MCFLLESHHFKIKTTYSDDFFPQTFKFFIIVDSQTSAPQTGSSMFICITTKNKTELTIDLKIRTRKQAFTQGKIRI